MISREPLITPEAAKRANLLAAFAAVALVTYNASALSAESQRGKQLAGRVCAICHVVFKGQSPGDPNAPSFRSIAKSRQFREKGVGLLWDRHPKMPNLALTQEELDDVTAYLKTLAK